MTDAELWNQAGYSLGLPVDGRPGSWVPGTGPEAFESRVIQESLEAFNRFDFQAATQRAQTGLE